MGRSLSASSGRGRPSELWANAWNSWIMNGGLVRQESLGKGEATSGNLSMGPCG